MKIMNNQPTSCSPSKSSWLRSESRTPPDSLSSTYGTKIIFIFINTVINAIIIIIIIIVMIGITIIIIEDRGETEWLYGSREREWEFEDLIPILWEGSGNREFHSRFTGTGIEIPGNQREREQELYKK